MSVTIDQIQVQFTAEIGELNKRLDEVQGSLNKANKKAESTTAGLKKLGVAMLAVFSVDQIKAFGAEVVSTFATFEKSLSNLRAITGLTTEEMSFFEAQARMIGRTTTLSAAEAAEAFKLIASAKPDLLDSRTALAEVTKEAITLAEAAGISLPQAASSLGITLNSLQLDASEAARVINVLAASAQRGAKEVPFVDQALSKFGGTAKSAGVEIETAVAAIQTLGASIPQAEIVGTSLRGVIVRLQQEAAKAKRPFEGLVAELERLKPIQNDINQLVEIFGREQLLGAQTLIANIDRLKELEGQITNTNTAYEQADINTNNVDGRIKELSSSYESLKISLGQLNEGPINNFLTNLTKMVRGIEELITGADKLAQNRAIEELPQLLKDIGVNISGLDTSDKIKDATDAIGQEILATRDYIKLQEDFIKNNQNVIQYGFGPRAAETRLRAKAFEENIRNAKARLDQLINAMQEVGKIRLTNTTINDLNTDLAAANTEASDLEKTLRKIAFNSAIDLDLEIGRLLQGTGVTSQGMMTPDELVKLAESIQLADEAAEGFTANQMFAEEIAKAGLVTDILNDGMQTLFSTLAGGGNVLEAFGNYLKQLAARLAAMAVVAGILTAISGGSGALAVGIRQMFGGGGFGNIFQGLSGFGVSPAVGPGTSNGPIASISPPMNTTGNNIMSNALANVQFRIEGSDLVASLDRSNRQRFRTS